MIRQLAAAGCALALLLGACSNNNASTESLSLTASPRAINQTGQASQIGVQAKETDTKPGSGTATLSAPAGSFGGGSNSVGVALDSDGNGNVAYNCNVANDPGCSGLVRINATWKTQSTSTTIQVGPLPDGGGGNPDGGNPDAGTPDGGISSGPSQIAFQRSVCGSRNPCRVMGIKGSGINEQVSVVFKILDDQLNPVSGVTTDFNILNPPAGLVWDLSSQSNSAGEVTTRVQAGPVVGVFSVQVSVRSAPSIRTVSPTIGVRGARPANQGFVFYCDRITLGAYISSTPPRIDTTTCRVKLNDRFNNPVGGTDVHFMTEAGSIPSTATTTAFDPDGENPDEGTATVTFSTAGSMPQNFPPFPPAPAQYPMPRAQEPSWVDGQLTRNPRNGLVTIMAFVRGEEYFSDDRGTGVWTLGEMFIDQGEPLVDSNDNGVWDPGERYLDLNGNGQWDGPNGIWNGDTTIWAETRILYTGLPYAFSFPSPEGSSWAVCPGGITRGSPPTNLDLQIWDVNMNRLPGQVAGSASATSTPTPPTGLGVTLFDGPLRREHFGFDVRRVLLDKRAGIGGCTGGSDAGCVWSVLFGSWDQGTHIGVQLADQRSDANPCSNMTVPVNVTVDSLVTTFNATGGVQ